MHLLIVIGTRPNFIKVTRFRKVLQEVPGAKLTWSIPGSTTTRRCRRSFLTNLTCDPTTS